MVDYNFVNNLALRNTDINEHLLDLYGVAVGMGAKTIVELGAGQSTFALTAAANETGGELYSIDISDGAHLRLYPEGAGILEKEPRYHFILGDDMEVVKSWDKKIDFLFIDTSHTYQHTRAELLAWPKFVYKWGVIAMHDTAHRAGDGMGCRKALNWFLNKQGKRYYPLFLLDTKHLGMAFIVKLGRGMV